MSSFKGRYLYSIDVKSRLALPAKLRKCISPSANDTLIITRGFEPCIFIYPADEWIKVEESIRSLNTASPKHRFVQREMMQWASDVTLDSQSRILIPDDLAMHAGIGKEVLVLGVLDRIEIWDPKRYEEYLNNQSETYETVAEQVFLTKT